MKYKFKNTIYNSKKELVYNELYNKDIPLNIISKYCEQFISYKDLLSWAIEQKDFKKQFNGLFIDAINKYLEDNTKNLTQE